MTKQAQKSAQTEETVAAAPQTSPQQQNLFISVRTFDASTNRPIGERIVDMHHFGTRNWLQNHLWWAMHHGHSVETNVATPEEIVEYVESQRAALAEKFNHADNAVAEEPAPKKVPAKKAA